MTPRPAPARRNIAERIARTFRASIVKGKLHEANKAPEEAIAAYVEAAKLAGDRDLRWTKRYAALPACLSKCRRPCCLGWRDQSELFCR